jgi:hypothetical protein
MFEGSEILPLVHTVYLYDLGFRTNSDFKVPAQNCGKRLLASSVCPHETTRLSLDGFSWNFVFEYFSEVCQKIQIPLKYDKNNWNFTWRPVYNFNLLRTVRHIYRTGVPLPSKCYILYIFSTNISTEYFKHAAHSPFFSSKCRLFYNATFFGSCFIHILHTRCAKI